MELREFFSEDAIKLDLSGTTKDDILRVAKKYLTPEKLVILIVGDKKDILLGQPDHPVKLTDLTTLPNVSSFDPSTARAYSVPSCSVQPG